MSPANDLPPETGAPRGARRGEPLFAIAPYNVGRNAVLVGERVTRVVVDTLPLSS
jgi:hypothetical protein